MPLVGHVDEDASRRGPDDRRNGGLEVLLDDPSLESRIEIQWNVGVGDRSSRRGNPR
ncbi:hypothetical protein HMPREF0569_1382 [Micrococcus luteus SK58]|nr:hypothetical protein HMPREF0569_1382 [Micrococcus luteus SK58]